MPTCGQILRFDSPLQVEPATEMAVIFTARPRHLARVDPSLWYGFGLFGSLLVGGAVVNSLRRPWTGLHEVRPATRRPPRSASPVNPNKPYGPDGGDDQNGKVSAEELL